MYLITFLTLFSKIDLSNIKPIFENGPLPIINGSLIELSYSIISLIVLLIIPKTNIMGNNRLNKAIIFFYIFNFITIFLVVFFILSIFNMRIE